MGHGQKLVWATDPLIDGGGVSLAPDAVDPDLVPMARAIPDAGGGAATFLAATAADAGEDGEPFGFYFPDAAEMTGDKAQALAALAKAMIEAGEDAAGDPGDADIPTVFTYLGQFIDHDMTAGTNTEAVTAALQIGGTVIEPQNRSLVVAGLRNMRKGTLQLDSLYGDGPVAGEMTQRLQDAMRDPNQPDKMRIGKVTPKNGTAPPLAPIPGEDLPRVGAIVGSAQFPTTDDLPEQLRPTGPGDVRWDRRAFIGDSRNDENLIVAQTHLAFLKLHNAFVDRGMDFADARQATVRHYQWLIVNAYLPAISDTATLTEVIQQEAPLYRHFLEARQDSLPPGLLPLPIEFSAAAFRFGHSMVRAEYDYNSNFTSTGGGAVAATFALMFAFTGNHGTPIGIDADPTLPDNWPIDWARFIDVAGSNQRRARKIDTRLAPPLFEMINEGTAASGLFQRLAERNLRRGHVLNVPSAQAVASGIERLGLGTIELLDADEITEGPTGDAIRDGDFVYDTPLWFYVLKEAELRGVGGRLGPLGTRLVAETLVGLIVNDAQSYWAHNWHPSDAATGGHAPIQSMADMFRAAGVLA